MQLQGWGGVVVTRPSLAFGVLGLVLMLVGSIGVAEAAPSRRSPKAEPGPEGSEALVSAGDSAMDHGDYEGAIAKYTAAYYSLSKDDRAGYIGSIPVRQAMGAYELLSSQKQSRELLERRLALVTEFLDAVATRPKGAMPVDESVVRELQAMRDTVEKKLAELTAEPVPAAASEPEAGVQPEVGVQTEPEVEVEPKPEPPSESRQSPSGIDPTPTEVSDDDRHERPSKAGIALAVTGGVVLGTGAGLLAGWWTVRDQAIEYADSEPGYEAGTNARDWYLGREEDRARGYLIAGSVVMGLGLVTAATGVALIVKQRRADKRLQVSLTPSFDGRHAGLVVGGRF